VKYFCKKEEGIRLKRGEQEKIRGLTQKTLIMKLREQEREGERMFEAAEGNGWVEKEGPCLKDQGGASESVCQKKKKGAMCLHFKFRSRGFNVVP